MSYLYNKIKKYIVFKDIIIFISKFKGIKGFTYTIHDSPYIKHQGGIVPYIKTSWVMNENNYSFKIWINPVRENKRFLFFTYSSYILNYDEAKNKMFEALNLSSIGFSEDAIRTFLHNKRK